MAAGCPAAAAALPVLETTVAGASVSTSSSGSVGCVSRRRMNPEGAGLTGTYRLSSMNLMNFSCAGRTRAGFARIWKVASGSGAFFSAVLSTW
jgi:hypothetical protein